MYVSLYRRYRPQNFSDVVGQPAAITVLQQSLNEKRIGHAYLFSGPRGCGKTSVARILAKALNCLSPEANSEPCCNCANCSAIAAGEHLDVIEIDGASNRGINEIRDLKTRVNLKPLNAQYKIYIIDEVHMLTEQAFNALLKTLEEPPANVVFMLATTEPNKVPVTIRSRCQHIPFHRISMSDLVARIAYICEREGIAAEQEAIWEIARQADGALRDALSLTEQAVALGNGKLTLESIKGLLGGSSRTELELLVTELRENPQSAAIRMHEIFSRGVSVENFLEALFNIYRDLWLYTLWGERSFEAVEASETEHKYIRQEAGNWTRGQLKAVCRFINGLMPRAKYGMKTEVFCGLLLLGLTATENEEKANTNYQVPNTSPQSSVASSQTENANMKYEIRNMKQEEQKAVEEIKAKIKPEIKPEPKEEAKPVTNYQIPVTSSGVLQTASENAKEEIKPEPKPEIAEEKAISNDAAVIGEGEDFVSALGGEYSKFISALKGNQLQIAAALLNADLVKDGDSWNFELVGSKVAETVFRNPQNKQLITDAVKAVYGIGEVAEAQPEAEMPKAEVKAPVVNNEPEPRRVQQPQTSAPLDRMLKLVGAEVLYVEEDLGSEESQGEDK